MTDAKPAADAKPGIDAKPAAATETTLLHRVKRLSGVKLSAEGRARTSKTSYFYSVRRGEMRPRNSGLCRVGFLEVSFIIKLCVELCVCVFVLH